ncbi:hypothetical protein HPO96_13440 [Kribbella sandramycini]|uniref:Uncharacterized protein n=1 Tax=Kribbella sandramycini TaxID=60450 RepID=A0A7Y4KYZ2_9ACTN|nr:hypothetical protein [Kribbella sandramycini]MBB6568904.1 hypothetical protein [Kribbella sandramycini]NOL41250.1 hypothetical protein [Kribbella sandramycini]
MDLDSDRLVDAYLHELATAAEGLPADRRDELLNDVTAHIAEARAGGATSEAEIREVLQRLGRPSDIVGAAADGLVRVPPRLRPWEYATLALLLVGPYLLELYEVLAFIVYAVGLGFLWRSNRWSTPWKLVGTLAWPLSYAAALLADTVLNTPVWLSVLIATVVDVAVLAALLVRARVPHKA